MSSTSRAMYAPSYLNNFRRCKKAKDQAQVSYELVINYQINSYPYDLLFLLFLDFLAQFLLTILDWVGLKYLPIQQDDIHSEGLIKDNRHCYCN